MPRTTAAAKGVGRGSAPLPVTKSAREVGLFFVSLWLSLSPVVRDFPPLAARAPLHLESSVHIGQEPDRDPALYQA